MNTPKPQKDLSLNCINLIVLTESFNNDLVIRYLDQIVVRDDGYEVIFKAGVTVEVEV